MKKIFMSVFTVVFVFSAISVFGYNCADKKDGNKNMHSDKKCHVKCERLFHMDGAVYKLQKTKAGVKILIFSEDKKVSGNIKEKAEKWFELRKKRRAAKKNAENEIVKCPVMGTEMKKAEAYSSVEYKGKTYYFCCAGCPETFKKAPEKYIE